MCGEAGLGPERVGDDAPVVEGERGGGNAVDVTDERRPGDRRLGGELGQPGERWLVRLAGGADGVAGSEEHGAENDPGAAHLFRAQVLMTTAVRHGSRTRKPPSAGSASSTRARTA